MESTTYLPVEVGSYPYHPVKGVSTLFTILFAISGITHIYQNSRYKSWYLLWLLPCTSIILTAGFICLEYNAFNPKKDKDAAPSQGLLYSAVPILSACLCLILHRLMVAQSSIHRLWRTVTWCIFGLFASVDITLTAQGTATFYNITASPASIRSGLALLKASLVILLFANVSLFGILGFFQSRYPKIFNEAAGGKAKLVLVTLYVEATLLLVRNLFRVVQIFSSFESSVWTSEVFFWVFDAVPLLLCMLLLNVLHPGKLLAGTPYHASGQC